MSTTKYKRFGVAPAILTIVSAVMVAFPAPALAGEEFTEKPIKVSGNLRTLNVLSNSTGLYPVASPLATNSAPKRGSDLFTSADRARINMEWKAYLESLRQGEGSAPAIGAHVEYDHQVYAGSAVSRPDFRGIKRVQYERQWLDLSQSIVEENGVLYEHSLYRAYLSFRSDALDVDIGRQQIPWGVGHFVTPTDVFNPLSITSLEPEERDGVDAVNTTLRLGDLKINYVFTPRGRRLHPIRHGVRVSGDIRGFEVGGVGGTEGRDEFIGYDIAGNVGDAVVRHELLYHTAEIGKSYVGSAVNVDYNFNNGLYALMEYAFNGRGESRKVDYPVLQLANGEIQHLGRHYLGLGLGYDITPLIRVEDRTFINLNDDSFYNRLEFKWSLRDDLMLEVGAIVMIGNQTDEFNRYGNLFYQELKWFF